MNTKYSGFLFAVFATFISADTFAFNVTPASFTSSEGTLQPLTITVESADWVYVGFDTACKSAYEFKIDLATSGDAIWSSDHTSGDINLDLGGDPFSLASQIVFCTTPPSEEAPAKLVNSDYSINLHADEVIKEGIEKATLNFNGICYVPPVIGLAASSAGGGIPKIEDTKLCPSSVNVNIVDTTPVPIVSISASDAAEPDKNGKIIFSLSEPAPAGGIVVKYSVSSSSTATASVDYRALGSSATISAGRTSALIPVVVIDDDLVEDRESVIVSILPSESYELGSSTSKTVFIVDDDLSVEVSISAADGAEPSANGMFTITLNEPAPDGGLTVNYAVSGSSTASASVDYVALGSSVLIPAAGLSVDIPVLVLDDDIAELAETVIVDIQDGKDYKLGSPATAMVSIVDDDAAGVHVSGAPLTVSEDGTSDQFSVVLTSQPLADVNVSVSSGNTIEATVDKAMLVFTASNWDSAQTVTVTGVDDDLDDGDVDFNIALMIASSDISYASMGPIDVAVTNHDNDEPASATFTQESYPFTEDVGSAEITVERAGVIGEAVSVTFSTDDGASGTTATAGEDYTSVSEVLEWDADDESSRTVEIPIMNDASSEGDETVVLKLEVIGSDLPAAFSELVIQNDFIEDVLDSIDPDRLPPNQRSITTVILTSCPTGLGQGGFQELCNDLIGEALAGGSVGNPLKQITPEQSAAARAPAAETVTVQNINVNGRMAALRAGATGFSASGFSFSLAGFNLNSGLFKGAGSGYDSIQPGFAVSNAAAGSSDDSFDDFGRWGIFVSGRAVFFEKDSTLN